MRAYEFLVENDIELPPDVVKAFTDLGEQQRGAPESAMLRVQHTMGGGVLNPVVEHVGDLTHRMSHMAKYGRFGYDMFADKVVKTLRWLTSPYGFEREFEENIRSNAPHKNMEPEELKEKIDKALEKYAIEHSKLPVYNKLQWIARQAAIDLGYQKFSSAISHLEYLNYVIKDVDRYNEMASQVHRSANGTLMHYKPGKSLNEKQDMIGPHEGQELELMVTGKKPAAMVQKGGMWYQFIQHAKKGNFEFKKIEIRSPYEKGKKHTRYGFAQKGEGWRLDRIQEIYDDVNKKGFMSVEDHREMGKLLGYSDKEINHFIATIEERR